MAIKMVREPSETPNINNIDDIVPMRYAYGNQNGYVIGKGTEISNTVNGLNFTVNSGRLVLQGVECDIDASGVTIAVDNIATKRYYVVYLQVNLGLNTAQILDTYDTATYPTIDTGDDLTENTTGVARLPLYRFIATSGIISEVNKVVESVKYTKDIIVNNATNADNAINASKINNLPISEDENKILSYILQEKVTVYIGGEQSSAVGNAMLECISIHKEFNIGDTFTYQGDTALVTEKNDDINYIIRVSQSGAIYAAQGSEIELDDQYYNIKNIIPYKRLLWEGEKEINGYTDIQLQQLNVGDHLKIEGKIGSGADTTLFKTDIIISAIVNYDSTSSSGDIYYPYYNYFNCCKVFSVGSTYSSDLLNCYIKTFIDNNGLFRIDEINFPDSSSGIDFVLLKIYQIIE